jgi:hypothetical protein
LLEIDDSRWENLIDLVQMTERFVSKGSMGTDLACNVFSAFHMSYYSWVSEVVYSSVLKSKRILASKEC